MSKKSFPYLFLFFFRYDRVMKKIGWITLGALICLIVMLPFLLRQPLFEPKSRAPQAASSSQRSSALSVMSASLFSSVSGLAHVVRAVDGDTLVVLIATKEERVRILGINAPESVDPHRPVQCFGPEASKRMHALADGKDVALIPEKKDDRDAFGRLLRYVEFDGEDLGAEMITEGFAENYCKKYPHPRCVLYDQLEQKARAAKTGLFGACVK